MFFVCFVVRILSVTPPPQLQNDLNQQQERFNHDARRYVVFLIIQFGVSYHFGRK